MKLIQLVSGKVFILFCLKGDFYYIIRFATKYVYGTGKKRRINIFYVCVNSQTVHNSKKFRYGGEGNG